jgi:transcriptional regulator with XRE-family HTH domain
MDLPNFSRPTSGASATNGSCRAYMSRVERGVTHIGLEIIGKLAEVLEVDPAEFFRRPTRSGSRKKID